MSNEPFRQAIRVICDNVSSHMTPAVQWLLADHSNLRTHHTPTHSSWLNQAENWFSCIQHDAITLRRFTSTKNLDNKLMRYICRYNKTARALEWKHADPRRRIRCDSSGSVD